eukprot:48660-Eustigmatos_ZCMA.PRE.1
MVTVRVSTGPLEEAMVANHNVVVMSDGSLAEAIRWDDFCHQRCAQTGPCSHVARGTSTTLKAR